jgi:hypothetical protein
LLIFVLAIPLHALSQTATGTLSGAVTDPTGALVPGAQVEIVSQGRGVVRSVTTNGEGAFVVPLLPPDSYSARVRFPGFATSETAVVVQVGDRISLAVQLKVGAVTGEVSVTDAAPIVQESATLGTVINREFLENLPLNGRTFQSLIALTPGVVTSQVALFSFRPGQFSVNGQRESTNNFTVDGVSANVGLGGLVSTAIGLEGQYAAFNALGGTNGLASVDALQEFRIQTSNFAPEFGRTPGAQVSLITRSGTNEYHGTAFGYYRDDALDANDWFANSRNLPKAPFNNYEFGGVLGGPVIKDRTFFFGSYEGLRLRSPQAGIRDVPTAGLRQSVSPGIRAMLGAFPLPNGRDYGNGFGEYSATWSNPATSDAAAIRIDHKLGDKLSFFSRYNYAPSESKSRGAAGNLNVASTTMNFVDLHTLTLGSTFLASTSLANDVRFNYSRNEAGSQSFLDDFGGAAPVDYSVAGPPFLKPGDHAFGINFTGTTANYTVSPQLANSIRQVQLVDTLSLVRGAHELKFGADYRGVFPTHVGLRTSLNFRFANQSDAMQGVIDQAVTSVREGQRRPSYLNLSLFAQDTWRLSRRLTLTYGVRWEYNPPPVEKNGKDIPKVVNITDPPNTDVAPDGNGAWKKTYNNFAPRFGISYHVRPSGRFGSIVRGGAGMFYDIVTTNAGYGYSTVFWPYSVVRRENRVPYPLEGASATVPVIARVPPYYVHAFDPGLKLPYTLQWNLSIEQALGSQQSVSLSYVGNAGRRLYRGYSYAPNAKFTGLFITTNEDYSDYNGLQVQFQRRLSRGLQANASYTWSNAIDTNSGEQDVYGASDAYPDPPARDRGAADYDVRHNGSVAISYKLPGPRRGGLAGAVLSGWAIDSIFRARSGVPIDVWSTAVNFAKSWRPDRIPGVPLYLDDAAAPGGRVVNKAAFSTPINGRHGTLGRNVVRGFGASQLDVAFSRNVQISERVDTQLRLEIFNILNQPSFGQPTYDLASVNFGRPTTMLSRGLGNLNSLYQVGGPRSMQLGLKLRF